MELVDIIRDEDGEPEIEGIEVARHVAERYPQKTGSELVRTGQNSFSLVADRREYVAIELQPGADGRMIARVRGCG